MLTMWSLGSLVLREHVGRIRGVDLTGDPAALGPWAVPASEILSRGVLPGEISERIRGAFATVQEGDR